MNAKLGFGRCKKGPYLMHKWLLFLMASVSVAWGESDLERNSVTGKDDHYREICRRAATEDKYFQNFRSYKAYSSVVEVSHGKKFARYLHRHASQKTRIALKRFKRLDSIGHPQKTFCRFPRGTFSATTLRYIIIADQIDNLFSLPTDAKIAEIGAGFGGQCYVLSQLIPFSQYFIYDLPEAEALTAKVMQFLNVQHVSCIPLEDEIPEDSLDLVISNFAFSECGRAAQLDYFNKIIKKAKRGYITYNPIARHSLENNYLTPAEFIDLLLDQGIHPQTLPEPVETHPENMVIVWGVEKP